MVICVHGGWGDGRGKRACFSQQQILFSITSKFQERQPWMERKTHIKKLLKMKYRFVRLELLDYLKYNFKKIPRTWYFPPLPTSRYFFIQELLGFYIPRLPPDALKCSLSAISQWRFFSYLGRGTTEINARGHYWKHWPRRHTPGHWEHLLHKCQAGGHHQMLVLKYHLEDKHWLQGPKVT